MLCRTIIIIIIRQFVIHQLTQRQSHLFCNKTQGYILLTKGHIIYVFTFFILFIFSLLYQNLYCYFKGQKSKTLITSFLLKYDFFSSNSILESVCYVPLILILKQEIKLLPHICPVMNLLMSKWKIKVLKLYFEISAKK